MAKLLSTVIHDGKEYKAGETVPKMDKKQYQALVDAGVVAGESPEFTEEVGTPNNPTRLGAGENNPQATVETIDAQIKALEEQKKALGEQKKLAEGTTTAPEDTGNEPPKAKSLGKMNKEELVAAGKERGLTFDDALSNREMREQIEAADAKSDDNA